MLIFCHLLSDKYDSTVLNNVKTAVLNYYTDIIDGISGVGGINRKGDKRSKVINKDEYPPEYRITSYTFVRRADSSKWQDGIEEGNKPASGIYWFHDGEDNRNSIILEKKKVVTTFIDFFEYIA